MGRAVNAIPVQPAKSVVVENVKHQYPTRPAVTLEAEILQVAEAVKRGFPRLRLQPLKDDWLSIVGYGPSLLETWEKITHPMITTSGAYDFLQARGVVSDYHTQMDGRDHQAKFLRNPQKETTFLMASICPPRIWDQLEGHRVLLWHRCNGQHVVDWIGENDDGGILIAGGSNIGLSAIHVGGILGFRKFKVFGLDGNFRGDVRHAGKHYDPKPQKRMKRNGWWTSPQMSNACDEFLSLAQNKDLQFEVHGKSLLKTLLG